MSNLDMIFKVPRSGGGSYHSVVVSIGTKHRVQHPLERWPSMISMNRPKMESRTYEFLLQTDLSRSRCCSVAKSCLTLCDPMDCSTPRTSVLHHLPEFVQIHVNWSQWYCLTISFSSSATLFSFSPQAFPASKSFPMRWLFPSGSQSTGDSVTERDWT